MKLVNLYVLFLPSVLSDYIAGVANHDVFFGAENDQANYLTDMNLQMYENLTAVASKHGAQVLVFPEFGLEPVHQANRTDLYAYAETVPAMSTTSVIPCNESNDFADRPIQLRMSCVAQKHSILVLVNMIDYQPCVPSADPNCPEDERYLYNTDVMFDESGAIVAKYHKTHVWLSNLDKYDQPITTEYVTYQSPSIGVEFGLFICFDIVFPDPAKVLVDRGVRHFLYAVQQAYLGDVTLMPRWSLNNNAALLAANIATGGKDGTQEDYSRVFVQGEAVRGRKFGLDSEAFPDENVLIVTVPTDF